MDMNRRNVLLGLGTAAAGSGAVFGSGAFTQVNAERDVTINIAADNNAFVATTDESPTNLLQVSNNTLTIDSSNIGNGSSGFNTDSTIDIGNVTTDPVVDNPAFEIVNNFDSTGDTVNLDVDLVLEGGDTTAQNVTLTLDESPGDNTIDGTSELTTGDGSSTGPITISGFGSRTTAVAAAITIDLTGKSSITDYGGTGNELSLTATTANNS